MFITDGLRAPESARERRRADWVALAWAGIAGRSARFANPEVALRIAIDIATRACGELRPAALKRPIGRRCGGATCWLCHPGRKQYSGENHSKG